MNVELLDKIKSLYLTDRKSLSTLIDRYLIPQELEKRTNAEVSTPHQLRQEMLDRIPLEFWSKPHRVFEPCCGKGGFLIDIIDRFMTGLRDEYRDEKERYRVIVEECLYWSDINPTNIYICRLLLDPLGEYRLNWNEGDTLGLDVRGKWGFDGFDGFDAVVGNPPYNASGNTGTGNTIWQLFTRKSLKEWVVEEGYLLFVHPPGWRKPNTEKGKFHKLYDLMAKQNQMTYLSIHGIKDGQQTFKCGTRYDWYVIERKKQYKKTQIKDEKGNLLDVDMPAFEWMPNYNIDIIHKILAKEGEEKCEIIQSMSAYEPRKKWMSKEKTGEYKFPCIHSITVRGPVYKYSRLNNKGHFGISKVIFGDSGINEPIIDINGDYGMTQHSMAIKINNMNEGILIHKSLKSDKMKDFIKSCLYSSFAIDWNIFKDMKKDFWKEFI